MTRPASPGEGFGRKVIFDIEANGLLKEVSTIHCIVAIDVETRECFSWRPWEVEEGLKFLQNCHLVVGHNVIDYDCRAIKKLHPWWKAPEVRDTLVMAKVVWPYDTLIGKDLELIRRGKLPGNLMKSQGLKAWGYRLGNNKGDYKGPWDTWSEEMHDYMVQDGWVNLDLYNRILERVGWKDPKPDTYVWPELPFEIEHKAATIISEQETYGFPFDREGAVALSATLQNDRLALEEKLQAIFGSWWAPLVDPRVGKRPAKDFKRKRAEFPDVTIPRFGKNGKALAPYVGPPVEEFATNAPFTPVDYVTFSASSRDHLGQRLQTVYGWKPKAYGNNGKPTVDETTLSEIPESIMPPDVRETILDFFVVNKTLGQLSVGNKSWLRLLGDDGRLHGRMDTCGAITSRGTHKDPNLGQVPAVSKNKAGEILMGLEGGFGWECRSLFVESLGEMTGTDASSLELLCLGHYLHPHDGGVFCDRVSDPSRDPHAEHSALTGETRADTKTVTYAYVYGAGPGKVGESLTITEDEIPELLKYKPLPNILGFYKKVAGDDWVEPDIRTKARIAKGHRVIKAFENGIPGIKELKANVTAIAQERGWLKGLDGRKLYVRKPHAALNTLLQGAGAIICKLWMIKVHEKLKAHGLG